MMFPFVPLANLAVAFAPVAYSISPALVSLAGAVKSILPLIWALSKAAVTTSPVVQQRGVVHAIAFISLFRNILEYYLRIPSIR